VNGKEGSGLRQETVGRRRWAARIAGAACTVAAVAIVLLATSAGGSNGAYNVRAIFDDAGNLIAGENVKIDGVTVGTVNSVVPTPHAKAAVTMHINNPGFQDFRADASCTIKPQALIGEKYVDCLPTQPRVEGTPLPPSLKRIPKGQEGEGELLLPVQNTHSPVDVDLLNDIDRLPEEQRFTIIFNELGAGLAGRGSDLREVLIRANPALQELDKVLAILASENHVLAKLAVDSDRALAPLAKVRGRVADFIVQSNTVAQATAAQRGALARNLALFPPFLERLGPNLERVGRFAEATTPTFTALDQAAPAIDKAFTNLPAFNRSSDTFFKNLGATAKEQGPALVATKPLLRTLRSLGAAGKPFAANFAKLFSSVRDSGGLERFLDFIFLGTGSANGYDALGHFLRTEGVGNTCLKYAIKPAPGCSAKLFNTTGAPASEGTAEGAAASAAARKEASQPGTSLVMARTLAVIGGATPAQAIAEYPGSAQAAAQPGAGFLSTLSAGAQPVGGTTAGTTYYTPSAEGSEAGGMLLNYLLGN
jgi:phospholipid/cholesterol/gamma-HCH transport system substrate-binding protein